MVAWTVKPPEEKEMEDEMRTHTKGSLRIINVSLIFYYILLLNLRLVQTLNNFIRKTAIVQMSVKD